MIDDAKIVTLPVAARWLFLCLVLLCGDNANDTITLSERQVNDYLTTRLGADNALSLLQSFQLVSYEVLNNRIELKRIKEKGREGKGSASSPPADAGPPPLVQIWNSFRGKLPACKSWDGPRKRKIAARWKEQNPEAWADTVRRISASDFCNGKNDRGWSADFDFLLKPDTWAKVNEGKYDNRVNTQQRIAEMFEGDHDAI